MTRKRHPYHAASRSSRTGAPPARTGNPSPPGLVSIDTSAGLGRDDISVGSKVTILGTGLYSGEVAVVERLAGGPIPSAVVRTEAGRSRQVRTIDLEPASGTRAPATD